MIGYILLTLLSSSSSLVTCFILLLLGAPRFQSLLPISHLFRKDPLFASLSNVINSVAPDFVFNKAKSERRGQRRKAREASKIVPKEFRTLWNEMSVEPVLIETPSPYPKVDWSCVNLRFITNIPSPSSFPIHGCSQDPDFYELKFLGYSEGNRSKFNNTPNPFGVLDGYNTSEGIVSVPTNSFHGYVWKNHGWILHSKLPSKSNLEDGGRREEQRRRGQRGGRRGERRRGRERGKRG